MIPVLRSILRTRLNPSLKKMAVPVELQVIDRGELTGASTAGPPSPQGFVGVKKQEVVPFPATVEMIHVVISIARIKLPPSLDDSTRKWRPPQSRTDASVLSRRASIAWPPSPFPVIPANGVMIPEVLSIFLTR